MRLGTQLPIFPEDQKDWQKFAQWTFEFIRELRQHWNGGALGFGDGTDVDNIFGTWISYTTNAIADTEDTIDHNLGVIPVGWLEFSRDKAGVLYKGASSWTSSQMFLKCNVASVTVLIFVIGPSSKNY